MQPRTASGWVMPGQTPPVVNRLRYDIDRQAMARDCELNGDLFTIQTAHDAVHVFGEVPTLQQHQTYRFQWQGIEVEATSRSHANSEARPALDRPQGEESARNRVL